jgi:hypothetical protein
MKNQNQPQQNPLHIHIDVLSNIRPHYTEKEYTYIKKLFTCLNINNTIVVNDTPIDVADLKMLLSISKRSASIFLNKLMDDSIMEITERRIGNTIMNTMVLSTNLAFKDNYAGRNTFKDISKGLDPIDLKTLPKLKRRKF